MTSKSRTNISVSFLTRVLLNTPSISAFSLAIKCALKKEKNLFASDLDDKEEHRDTGVSNPVPRSFSRTDGQLPEKITGNEVVLFHTRDFCFARSCAL